MPGVACYHSVFDNVLCSNDHNVVRAALAGPCFVAKRGGQLIDVTEIGGLV